MLYVRAKNTTWLMRSAYCTNGPSWLSSPHALGFHLARDGATYLPHSGLADYVQHAERAWVSSLPLGGARPVSYEHSEDYEKALEMRRLRGVEAAPLQYFATCEVYLAGWLMQLQESAAASDAKNLLASVYSLLEEAEGVDEELKDSLSDCPKDTREFWAWCYGQMAGRLFIAHSYLKEAFLHAMRRSEWVEGWPVISLMVEEHVEWSEYRRTCMALYEVADVEYKGARPWNAPQPAHLSPESDLYWAMRVGFCDAHIEAAQGSAGPTPAEIGSKLDDLRQMVSASSLRSMRSFEEVKRDVGSLGNAIPTAEGARNIVAGAVGEELLETPPRRDCSASDRGVGWRSNRDGLMTLALRRLRQSKPSSHGWSRKGLASTFQT